jgi:Phosphomannomutase
MSRKYFGTDGIRGRVGEFPITPDFMLKLGWAAGMAFRKQGHCRVLVGKDTRISGYMFESALEAGLSAAGADVMLLGPMPTRPSPTSRVPSTLKPVLSSARRITRTTTTASSSSLARAPAACESS